MEFSRRTAISLGWSHARALATNVSVMARLAAAPILGSKDTRASPTEDVTVEREERVSATARIADSPLPVEAGLEGVVCLVLVPSAHLHPAV